MRLKREKQVAFDKHVSPVIDEYKARRHEPETIDLASLLLKHECHRDGKPYTAKAFSGLLVRRGIQTQRDFHEQMVKDSIAGINPDQLDSFSSKQLLSLIREKTGLKSSTISKNLALIGVPSFLPAKVIDDPGAFLSDYREQNLLVCELREIHRLKSNSEVIGLLKYFSEPIREGFLAKNPIYEFIPLQVETLWSAHFLGVIWSDGSISSGSCVIDMFEPDKAFIDALAISILNPEKEWDRLPVHNTGRTKSKFGSTPMCRLTISRIEYAKYINRIGLPRNKETQDYGLPSWLPSASDEHLFAFLLGLHEGDGTLTNDGRGKPVVSICVSESVGITLKEIFNERFGISSQTNVDKSTWSWRVASTSGVLYLLARMYSSIFDNEDFVAPVLQRKWNKACDVWKSEVPRELSQICPTLIEFLRQESSVQREVLLLFSLSWKSAIDRTFLFVHPNHENQYWSVREAADFLSEKESDVRWLTVPHKRSSIKGWSVPYHKKVLGVRNSTSRHWDFVNRLSNSTFSGSLDAFCERYLLSPTLVQKMIEGEIKHVSYWSLGE